MKAGGVGFGMVLVVTLVSSLDCAPTRGSKQPGQQERSVAIDDTRSHHGSVDPAPLGNDQEPALATGAAERTFDVFFPDEKDPAWKSSCAALTAVVRTLPESTWSAEAAIRVVLAGPTLGERSAGLIDPYRAPYGTAGDERLGDYLRGVQVTGDQTIIDFSAPALRWLNGAACLQAAVKTPMERTLREAFGANHVEYAVDGRIYSEWDA